MTASVVATDCVLLINPTSGRGQGRRYGERAEAALTAAGYRVRPVIGSCVGEAVGMARRTLGRDGRTLVVVGGDGMISAALPLVAGTGVALGLIPAGTGNDTARFLGVPRNDPEAAAQVIIDGRTGLYDLGQVRTEGRADPHWFTTVLACGLDSKVNERANLMRWPRGSSRYTLALLAELLPFRASGFRLELDGGEPIDRRCMLIAVGNGPNYGGGMLICPSANPQDGRFHITVVSEVRKSKLLLIFPKVFKGEHVKHPAVAVHEAERVVLRGPAGADGTPAASARPFSVWADGEYVGVLPAEIVTVPGALKAFVPSAPAGEKIG